MTLWLVKWVDKNGCTQRAWPKFLVMVPGQLPMRDIDWPPYMAAIYDKVRQGGGYHPDETIPGLILDAGIVEFDRRGCSLSI